MTCADRAVRTLARSDPQHRGRPIVSEPLNPAERAELERLRGEVEALRTAKAERRFHWKSAVSAVLIVLQTHLRFEKDKQGKWSIIMEKKPTDATLPTEA